MRHASVCSAFLLTLAMLGPARSFGQAIDDWVKIMTDPRQPADKRAGAREKIIEMAGPKATLTPNERVEVAKRLADRMLPLLASPEKLTALNAAIVAACIHHLHFVPVLKGGVGNPQAMVRYWSAKGLADSLSEMYKMGDKGFFEEPLQAAADQLAREDSAAVAAQLYHMFVRQAGMDQAGQNQVMYRHFLRGLRGRIQRLDQGKDDLLPEVAGLEVSGQWCDLLGGDKAVKGDILVEQAQLLKWATQRYVERNADLAEQQRSELEQIILRAAQLIAKEIGKPAFFDKVKQQLLTRPDPPGLMLTVIEMVGGPGMELTGFGLQPWVGNRVAKDLSAPTTQP